MIQKNEKIVLRKVGNFYFLVDPCKSYNDDDEDVFQTDEIGAAIWNSILGKTNTDEIYSRFVSQLTDEITEELQAIIRNDLANYLRQLKKEKMIFEV